MKKLHFEELNPIDFRDSKKYKTFERNILKAMGDHIDNDEIRKKYFAIEIYELLPKSIKIGRDLEKLGPRIKLLLKLAEKAKSTSEKFYSQLMTIHSESEPFVGDPFDRILKKENDVFKTIKTFDYFIQEINYIKETFSKYKSGKILKRGPDNIVALVVSNYLAFTYHRFFGQAPGAGRGEKKPNKDDELATCVFDRICEVVESAFPVEIAISTIRIAQETYPRWYKIEKIIKDKKSV